MLSSFIVWSLITSAIAVLRIEYFKDGVSKEIEIACVFYYIVMLIHLGIINTFWVWVISNLVALLYCVAEGTLNVAEEDE